MKYKLLHLQSLIAASLCVIMSMTFTSCSGVDDVPEPIYSPANAKGVLVDDNGSVVNVNLWINEYGIVTASQEENEICLDWVVDRAVIYYTVDVDLIYQFLSEAYGWKIDENTDFTHFNSNPERGIEYIKRNKLKYRYMASGSEFGYMCVLFNRTSSVNYEK